MKWILMTLVLMVCFAAKAQAQDFITGDEPISTANSHFNDAASAASVDYNYSIDTENWCADVTYRLTRAQAWEGYYLLIRVLGSIWNYSYPFATYWDWIFTQYEVEVASLVRGACGGQLYGYDPTLSIWSYT